MKSMSQTRTKAVVVKTKDEATNRRRSRATTPQPAEKDITPPGSAGSTKCIRTRLSTGTLFMNGTSTIKDIKTAEDEEVVKITKETCNSKKRTSVRDLSPSVPVPKRRKVAKNDGSGNDNKNDYFCWICHKDGLLVGCELCSRVFHTKCLNVNNDLPTEWVCPECEQIMKSECIETRSKAMSMIIVETLCNLLKHALRRMQISESEPFDKPVDQVAFPNYSDFVYYPMDLGLLAKNIKKKMYGCTEAFLADTKWIYHNCLVFNGSDHHLTKTAKAIIKICRHEMNEIEVCPDCYLNSCAQEDADWFCQPCRSPHTLTWAKLKGYPFWPAKALREADGLVDVRFFGAHDRSWVPISNVFLLSKECPIATKKRSVHLVQALGELNKHVEKIREKIGSFEYHPFRTPYNINHMYKPTILKTPSQTIVLTPKKKPTSIHMKKALLNKYNSISTGKKTGNPNRVVRATIDKTECELIMDKKSNYSRIRRMKIISSAKKRKKIMSSETEDIATTTESEEGLNMDLSECLGESSLLIIQDAISGKITEDTKLQTSKDSDNMAVDKSSESALVDNKYGEATPGVKNNSKESSVSCYNTEYKVTMDTPSANIQNDDQTVSDFNEVINKTSECSRIVDKTLYNVTELSSNETQAHLTSVSPSKSVANKAVMSHSATKIFDDETVYDKTLPGVTEISTNETLPSIPSGFSTNETVSDKHLSNVTEISTNEPIVNRTIPQVIERSNNATDESNVKATEGTDIKYDDIVDKSNDSLHMDVDSSDDTENEKLIIDLKDGKTTESKELQSGQSSNIVENQHPELKIALVPKDSSVSSNSANINPVSPEVLSPKPENATPKINTEMKFSPPKCSIVPSDPVCNTPVSMASTLPKTTSRPIVSNSPPPGDKEETLFLPEAEREECLTDNLQDMIKSYTKKLSNSLENTLSSLCRDLVTVTSKRENKVKDDGNKSNEIPIPESRQIELLKWAHTQQIQEMKYNFKLQFAEISSSWESEITRVKLETVAECETTKKQAVDEAKKKQWCAKCLKEAIYYCCWNTSYCAYTCQQAHWPQHMTTCMQAQKTAAQQLEESNKNSQPQVTTQPVSTSNSNSSSSQSSASFQKTKASDWLDNSSESAQVQRTFNLAPPMENNGDNPVWRNRANKLLLPNDNQQLQIPNNSIPQFQPQNPSNIIMSSTNQHQQALRMQPLGIQPTSVLPTIIPNNALLYPVLRQQQPIGNHNTAMIQQQPIGNHNTAMIQQQPINNHNTNLLQRNPLILAQQSQTTNQMQFQRFQLQNKFC